MVLIGEEILVERVLVVLENVQSKPRSARRPYRRGYPRILRSCIAPYISMVVADEAAVDAIHLLCRYPAVLAYPFKQVEQRQMTFGEITALGAPVVHLGVDVERVAASPCRPHILIPYALQIHRLSAGTAR